MVRPRGKSNPMLKPTRLLKTSSSGGASVLNLQMAPVSALTPALEEDLESQARASLSLFGFGVDDAVNWSLVHAADSSLAVAAATNGAGSPSPQHNGGLSTGSSAGSATGLGGGAGASSSVDARVKLLERVCPIGTNSFLWNTMNLGESGMNASLVNDPSAVDATVNPGEDDPDWDPLGYGHIFGSKILQQYLVKSVVVVPASVEEVVDLIIRSDRDDMETAMHHFVGVKTTAAGIIYRRKRRRGSTGSGKHPHRRHHTQSGSSSSFTSQRTTTVSSTPSSNSSSNSLTNSGNGAGRSNSRPMAPSGSSSGIRTPVSVTPPRQFHHLSSQSQSTTDLSDSSSTGGSDDDDDDEDEEEVVEVLDGLDDAYQAFTELNRPLPTAQRQQRPGLRSAAASMESHSNNSSSSSLLQQPASHNSSTSSLVVATAPLPTSMPPGAAAAQMSIDEYRTALTQGGQQGNLSLRWVVGERNGRMFSQRANYCLLDYECVLVNDWEDDAGSGDVRPMYVRALQSVYLPQCQPWLDELGTRPTDLQPTGIMVREAPHAPGCVEVQFVASVLEKAQLPMTARRSKLRALCAKIGKLEEVLTSRRLSQSLLAHQPHWVSDRERPVCHCCEKVFNLRRRRHHCRLCGEICCSDCCPKKDVALPEVGTTSVRVCTECARQKRRHSGDVLEQQQQMTPRTPVLSPVARGVSASPSTYLPTPPPLHHPLLGSSHSSPSPSPDFYLSSSSSYSSGASFSGSASSAPAHLGERKPSYASAMFHKLKSSSSNLSS